MATWSLVMVAVQSVPLRMVSLVQPSMPPVSRSAETDSTWDPMNAMMETPSLAMDAVPPAKSKSQAGPAAEATSQCEMFAMNSAVMAGHSKVVECHAMTEICTMETVAQANARLRKATNAMVAVHKAQTNAVRYAEMESIWDFFSAMTVRFLTNMQVINRTVTGAVETAKWKEAGHAQVAL